MDQLLHPSRVGWFDPGTSGYWSISFCQSLLCCTGQSTSWIQCAGRRFVQACLDWNRQSSKCIIMTCLASTLKTPTYHQAISIPLSGASFTISASSGHPCHWRSSMTCQRMSISDAALIWRMEQCLVSQLQVSYGSMATSFWWSTVFSLWGCPGSKIYPLHNWTSWGLKKRNGSCLDGNNFMSWGTQHGVQVLTLQKWILDFGIIQLYPDPVWYIYIEMFKKFWVSTAKYKELHIYFDLCHVKSR